MSYQPEKCKLFIAKLSNRDHLSFSKLLFEVGHWSGPPLFFGFRELEFHQQIPEPLTLGPSLGWEPRVGEPVPYLGCSGMHQEQGLLCDASASHSLVPGMLVLFKNNTSRLEEKNLQFQHAPIPFDFPVGRASDPIPRDSPICSRSDPFLAAPRSGACQTQFPVAPRSPVPYPQWPHFEERRQDASCCWAPHLPGTLSIFVRLCTRESSHALKG